MQITVTDNLPQTYQAAVEAAVAVVDAMIADPVTAPLTFALGAPAGDVSASIAYGNWMAYGGASRVFVTDAQQVAMDLGTPTDPAFGIVQIDGNVPWGTGGYDLNGALIHEITEALGRLATDNPASPTILDLHKPALPFASAPIDPGDFAGTTPDAFDGQFAPGVVEPLTLSDLAVMGSIGFHLSDRVSVAVNPNGTGLAGIDSITASTGQISFASFVSGTDPHTLNAAAGNETLAAGMSSGPATYRLSTDGLVVAGAGDDTIYAGSGNDTIWTGTGNNLVVLDRADLSGAGTVTLLNFAPGRDRIDLVGFGGTIPSVSGASLILPDGTRLILAVGQFSSSDFVNG